MTQKETLTIGTISARPGTRAQGTIEVGELPDSSRIQLPLVLINGAKSGERLYLGAGIHGDEVNSIAITSEALARVDPVALAGEIVCIPVQHPLALNADHRLPLAQFLKSPLDQAPADAWTCFPGDAYGNMAEQLAAAIFAVIRTCDYALDIHTPTRGGRYVPIAILPHKELPAYGKAKAFAGALDPGWIMEGNTGMYVSRGILCVEATRAGIPSFTFEIGEGGRLEPPMVRTGAGCVLNAMMWLRMIDGQRQMPQRRYEMKSFLGIRAKRGGLLYTDVELGSEVERGTLLCRTVNIYGEEVERVLAPENGVFVRATTLSTVATGDRVATLGLLQ